MKIDRSSDLIVVGGRQMKLSRGQVEFAKSAPWHLHEGPVSIGYRNFKLYLDERKGLKKVWYLSVKKGEIVESADLKKLREFNPDMEPWVLDAINGNVRQAPTPMESASPAWPSQGTKTRLANWVATNTKRPIFTGVRISWRE